MPREHRCTSPLWHPKNYIIEAAVFNHPVIEISTGKIHPSEQQLTCSISVWKSSSQTIQVCSVQRCWTLWERSPPHALNSETSVLRIRWTPRAACYRPAKCDCYQENNSSSEKARVNGRKTSESLELDLRRAPCEFRITVEILGNNAGNLQRNDYIRSAKHQIQEYILFQCCVSTRLGKEKFLDIDAMWENVEVRYCNS